MSNAAENLARWQEAEQGASSGPWQARLEYDDAGDYTGGEIVHTYRSDGIVWPNQILIADIDAADAEFVTASRDAMPELLAFAEAVLALHVDDDTFCRSCDYRWPCPTVRLAEQHLGGASS